MKKNLAALVTLYTCVFFFTSSTFAQQLFPYYNFSQSSGSYSAITGGTVAGSGTGLNSQMYKVHLPFSFTINNKTYDTAYISVNGYLAFGGNPGGSIYWPIAYASNGIAIAAGFATDLASLNSSTELRYQTIGTTPNRVFVVQWKNFAHSTYLKTSFQVRLSEYTSEMTAIYDTVTYSGTSSLSVQVGLRDIYKNYYFHRQGSWSNSYGGTSYTSNIITTSSNKPSQGLQYKFTPPQCSAPNKPTDLTLNATFYSINGIFKKSSNADKYLVIRTNGDSALTASPVNGVTYSVNSVIGNGTVIKVSSSGSDTTFYNSSALSPNTLYRITVIPYDELCLQAPLYNTSSPLSDTIRTFGPKKYYWLPTSGTKDFQVDTNWTPARIMPHNDDTLIFVKGGTVTINNFKNTTCKRLIIDSNTHITLSGNSSSNRILQVKDSFYLDSSSSLTLGGNPVTFQYGSTTTTYPHLKGHLTLNGGSIYKAARAYSVFDGVITMNDSAQYIADNGVSVFNIPLTLKDNCSYLAKNGTTYHNTIVNITGSSVYDLEQSTVTFKDSVKVYGANAYLKSYTQQTVSFPAGSVYAHMRDGGKLPIADFDIASKYIISGLVNTTPNWAYANYKPVGTLIWDCPNQSVDIDINAFLTTVNGDLHIVNTGGHAAKIGDRQITVHGNFTQDSGTVYQLKQGAYYWSNAHTLNVLGNVILNSGGVLDLNSLQYKTTSPYSGLTARGNFIQKPGHKIIVSGYLANLDFISDKHQIVEVNGNLSDASDTARISFSLDNSKGATLSDTLTVHDGATNLITTGIWSGAGAFRYDSASSLSYSFDNAMEPIVLTNKEWPSVNPPTNVSINTNNRVYPYTQMNLHGDRVIKGKFTLTKGILHLNDYNLTIDNGNVNDFTLNSVVWTKMITASGNGYLIRKIDPVTSNKAYDFPIGDNVGNPEYSGVHLQVTKNDSVRYIGVRVRDMKHPANTDTVNTVNRYWTFTDNGSSTDTMTYVLTLDYPLADDVAGNIKSIKWRGNSNWHNIPIQNGAVYRTQTYHNSGQYYYTAVSQSIITTAHDSLNNKDYTIGSAPLNIRHGQLYTWTGSVDNDYQKAGNWTPTRNSPSLGDSIRFNNGGVDTVGNIAGDSIRNLVITNNTRVYFKGVATTGNGDELVIVSDTNTTTNEIVVDSGSAMYVVDSVHRLVIYMVGDSCNAYVAGKIELNGWTTSYQRFVSNCVGCSTIVAPTGTLVRNEGSYFSGRDTNSYIIYGQFNNKYPYPDVGIYAVWKDHSKMIMSGMKYSSYSSYYQSCNYYDLEINSPATTANCIWDKAKINVRNETRIISTGSGSFDLRAISFATKKFRQTGGTLNLNTEMDITDSLIHSGGVLDPSGSINFRGEGTRQYVSLHDSSTTLPKYSIYNPHGIKVIGTGSLTIDLNVNYIYVYAEIDTPLLTPLNIKYPSGSGSVTYNIKSDYKLDTTYLLPATGGPAELEVIAGGSNLIELYASRKFSRINISQCVLDIGANNLELGTSPTDYGLLFVYNKSGSMNIDSGGSIKIWLPTGSNYYYATSLNSFNITSLCNFPIAYNRSSRRIAFYFNSSQPFSTGGSMTITPMPGTGITNGLSVTDGTYTIGSRSNTGWAVSTGNGLTLKSGKTITMAIFAAGPGIGLVDTVDSLRIMTATSVVGNHINGQNSLPPYLAQRSNLTINDINDTFYLGTSSANIHEPYISVQSGRWNVGSTWNKGTVPGHGDSVLISNGHNIITDTTCSAGTLLIGANGSVSVTDSTFSVDSNINSEGGSVLIEGGNMVLGPHGGGKADFRFYGGGLQVDSGRLEVNGSLRILKGFNVSSQYIQTGGDVVIDGNAGGDTLKSVPAGRPLMYLSGQSYDTKTTGGTLTFVDPHAGTDPATSNVLEFDDEFRSLSGLDHLYFGDGISTDSGGHIYGFRLSSEGSHYMGRKLFPAITIRGSASGKNRVVTHPNMFFNVAGDLILTGPGKVYDNLGALITQGDIYIDTGAIFGSEGSIAFAKTYDAEDYVSYGSINTHQRLYGPGSIEKDTADWTIATLYVDNTNNSGVSIEIGDFEIYNLRLANGMVTIGDTATITINRSVKATDNQYKGWIVGNIKQKILAKTTLQGVKFPLGDSNGNYTPIVLNLPSVQSEGYILAHTKTGEHPNVSSSKINSTKDVNVQYSIDTIGNFVGSGIYLDLQWANGSVDPGAYWSKFIAQARKNNAWKDYKHTIVANNAMRLDSFTNNNISGVYITGEPGVAPIITQHPQNDTACSGGNIILTVVASPVDSYRWQGNSGGTWANINDDTTYTGSKTDKLYISGIATAMDNNKYRCILYNIYDSTVSNFATLKVNTTVVPTISVTANPGDTICAGTSVTFTANITNGGNTPIYTWKKNNVFVAQTASYTPDTLMDGDIITATLVSSSHCASPDTVSDTVTMVVNPSTSPVITISSNKGDTICTGATVTFTATTANAGSGATLLWTLNGIGVGNTTTTYTNPALSNGDKVSCVLNSNTTCATPSIVRDTIQMHVFNNDSLHADIGFITGDSVICFGRTVWFRALVNGNSSNTTYQWKKNGNNVSTSSDYMAWGSLRNNDQIVLICNTTRPCFAPSSDTDTVRMTVHGNVSTRVNVNASPNDTVCAGTPVSFTAVGINAGTSPHYEWKKNGTIQSVTGNVYNAGTLSNNDVVSVKMTSSYACVTSAYAYDSVKLNVRNVVAPSISISKNKGDTICAGTSVTFTAAPVNGGSTPAYQWQKNGANVGSGSNVYTTTSLSDKDTITCILTSSDSCLNNVKDTSSAIVMTVTPLVTPLVSVSVSPDDTICSGTSVTFTATPANGGSTPSYQWKINGTNVGTNSTYSSSSLSDKDTVKCILTTSVACPSIPDTMDEIVMTVRSLVTPTLTIAPSPGDTVCAGTSVTYTATPTNGGSTPSYQWKVNGTNAGTGSSYTSSGFSNNDVVKCILTSNRVCRAIDTAAASDTMTIITPVTPNVAITASPNNTICSGTSVTFTATPTNGGSTPSYQWKLNGNNSGSNTHTYINSALSNGDVVTCVLTSSKSCVSRSIDTSNSISMTVNQPVTPSVSIVVSPNDTVCAGTSVTFTATPVNGGSNLSYQWKRNGTNIGSNSNTYTGTVSNNDIITCVLSSSLSCVTKQKDTSNAIRMTVDPKLTPSVTIAVAPGNTVCSGSSATFTATPANGGNTPAYQWKLNNNNVGTNSSTYTNGFSNNDVISCVLTSSNTCVTKSKDTSNNITMTVNPVLIPSLVISVSPDDTVCVGTNTVFTANPSNGGTSPAYQWKLNGVNAGTNSATYSNSSLNNSDVVTCRMTSNATCANPTTATSKNNITMTVNPLVTPSVSVAVTPGVMVGPWVPVTFTATPTNGGALPSYQWKRNGTNIPSATNATYIGKTNVELSDSDVICVLLTSNADCATPDTASRCASPIHINLSASDIKKVKDLRLYPNPNTGMFTIKGQAPTTGLIKIRVLTITGQTVYETSVQPHSHLFEKTINISGLSQGNYSLQLIADEFTENINMTIR